MSIAPDGTWVATTGNDKTVRIWDAATGQQRAVLQGHTDDVRSLAIAPDGTWLATASNDKTVRIWDSRTSQQRNALAVPRDDVRLSAISPNGAWLATITTSGVARIWGTGSGNHRAILPGHTEDVSSLAIAPDGTWLATNSDSLVRIWDLGPRQQLGVLAGPINKYHALSVSSRNELNSVVSDVLGRALDPSFIRRHTEPVRRAAPVYGLVISPDSTWLAVISSGGTIRIWEAVTGTLRALLIGHTDDIRGIAIAPDSQWLATTSYDRTTRIWDADTGQQNAVLGSRTITFWAEHPRLKPIGDFLVRVWEAAIDSPYADKTHVELGPTAAIAPDCTWLASCSGAVVRIWDAATGNQRAVLRGHTDDVRAIEIAPNGDWIATASNDTLRIWDVATGRQIGRPISNELADTIVRNSADTVLETAPDRLVGIWEAATDGQPVTRTRSVDRVDAVIRVAIAPDGSKMAVVSSGGTLRIWDQSTNSICAVMRVDAPLQDCRWNQDCQSLDATGEAGVYRFTLLS